MTGKQAEGERAYRLLEKQRKTNWIGVISDYSSVLTNNVSARTTDEAKQFSGPALVFLLYTVAGHAMVTEFVERPTRIKAG